MSEMSRHGARVGLPDFGLVIGLRCAIGFYVYCVVHCSRNGAGKSQLCFVQLSGQISGRLHVM